MRAQTTAQLFRTGSYLAPVVVATLTALTACAPTAEDDDIAGVVTRTGEPEAGVWVIAETADLSTRFARIVVTDDQGRYVIPDLPEASYDVWVRGYGLVDSEKLKTSPGTVRDLTAVAAPDARAAAEYYPAGYWLSLLHVPEDHEFPGTGDEGNLYLPEHPEPGPASKTREVGELHGLPSARHHGYQDDPRRLWVSLSRRWPHGTAVSDRARLGQG